MAPPFWVHCNLCNALLSKNNRHFFLSCSHIACKDCLKPTGGKKCPICKADIRYEEMSKLPENLKKNFQPKIQNLFQEPAKILHFQQAHIRNIAKKTRDYRQKYNQAKEIYEKEKNEVMKIKKQLDQMIQQRKLMQEKLKQIYMQNQMKKQHEIYRNPANETISSDFSSKKERSLDRTPNSVTNKSDFFNHSTTAGKEFISSSSGFFDKHQSTPRKTTKKLEHTQSNRKPFFS